MADNTKKLKIYQILFAALTLAVMVTIFVFSSEDADTSSQTSSSLTKVAVTIIDKNYYNEPPCKAADDMASGFIHSAKAGTLFHIHRAGLLRVRCSRQTQALYPKEPRNGGFRLSVRSLRRVPPELFRRPLLRIPRHDDRHGRSCTGYAHIRCSHGDRRCNSCQAPQNQDKTVKECPAALFFLYADKKT